MNILIDFLDFRGVVVEVLLAFGPLIAFFLFFQFYSLKLPRYELIKIGKGVLLAAVGLVFFLQGVKKGFLPAGSAMGEAIASIDIWWIAIPIGFCFGFVATYAEPAVRILASEVENASNGGIPEKIIVYILSGSVALFVGLSMVKIIFGIPIMHILIPCYVAALIIMYFSDPVFTSIAFDAGGVATGPMTVTFVMALAIGIADSMENRNPVLDGFGLVALVALAPILSVMILGLIYKIKRGRES